MSKTVRFQTIHFCISTWKSVPYSSKFQHHWNLTFRLFSVISGTLIGGGVLLLCKGSVGVFYSPSRLGKEKFGLMWFIRLTSCLLLKNFFDAEIFQSLIIIITTFSVPLHFSFSYKHYISKEMVSSILI